MKLCSTTLALALAIFACSCGKDDDKKAPGNAAAETPKLGADWSTRQTKPVNDVVDGIAFTVSLPDGLKREVKKADDSFPGYVTWRHNGDFWDMPGFTVQIDAFPPATLEDAASELKGMKKDRITAVKEKLEDGFLAASHEANKQFLNVKVWRKYAKGKYVGLSMVQRMSTPIPNFEAQRAWLVKVARTFKVTAAK